MGYRANLVTQHREYGRNVFYSYSEFESWLSFVRNTYEQDADNIYESESEDYYEIPREIFEAEIKRFKQMKPEQMDDVLQMEAQDIVENFEKTLKEAVSGDDFVTLEWY